MNAPRDRTDEWEERQDAMKQQKSVGGTMNALDRLRALHAAATPDDWEPSTSRRPWVDRVAAAENHNAMSALLACVDALRAVQPDHPALTPLLEEQP